jgi:hypothetical protein
MTTDEIHKSSLVTCQEPNPDKAMLEPAGVHAVWLIKLGRVGEMKFNEDFASGSH